MVSKAQKLRLAVFFIIGFSILLSIFVMLLGSKITEKRDIYRIVYEDTSVAGLQIGGAVLYRGIRLGRIEDIHIDKDRITDIVVNISVKKGTPIKADQEATIVMVGITGMKQIELSGGTNESPFLKPGATIRTGRTFFENISDRAEVMAIKFEQIMDNIIAITNYTNQERLGSIIFNIDSIIDRSHRPLTQTMQNIEDITSELTIATMVVNDLLAILDSGTVGNIVGNMERITANFAEIDVNRINHTIQSLNEAIQRTTMTINHIDALVQKSSPDLNASIEELRETIENLNEFSRIIAEDPSLLIRSRRN